MQRTKGLLLAVAPVLCIWEFIASVGPIDGKSMTPTLNPDTLPHNVRDWVVLDKLSVHKGAIQRGDIVTFTPPFSPDKTFVKRVVAMEGDLVHTRKPAIPGMFLTGQEPVIPSLPKVVRIPKGYCWVESDESFRGVDSNAFGPIPLGLIQARVAYLAWPPSRIGPLPPPEFRKGIDYWH